MPRVRYTTSFEDYPSGKAPRVLHREGAEEDVSQKLATQYVAAGRAKLVGGSKAAAADDAAEAPKRGRRPGRPAKQADPEPTVASGDEDASIERETAEQPEDEQQAETQE